MTRMSPALGDPDDEEWARHFPEGLGPGACSAPAWQQLMLGEESPGQRLLWLRLPAEQGPLHLPVLAGRVRGGRWRLTTRPVAYPVEPVERAFRDPADLEALLDAVATPWIPSFESWLAPWSPLSPAPATRRLGRLRVDRVDTFLIRLAGGALEHVTQRLGRSRRRWLAANEAHGVVVSPAPDPEQRRAFEALYQRTHAGRGWVGPPFSSGFFEGAATRLGRGGELCVVLLEGRVVGGGVLLFDRQAAHYFMGAVDRSAVAVSPHDALYRYALEEAERRGLEWIHLGGINPGNEGLARFKRAWGAVPAPLSWLRWEGGVRVLWQTLAGTGRTR
jgi:hypothetical protein